MQKLIHSFPPQIFFSLVRLYWLKLIPYYLPVTISQPLLDKVREQIVSLSFSHFVHPLVPFFNILYFTSIYHSNLIPSTSPSSSSSPTLFPSLSLFFFPLYRYSCSVPPLSSLSRIGTNISLPSSYSILSLVSYFIPRHFTLLQDSAPPPPNIKCTYVDNFHSKKMAWRSELVFFYK